MVGTSPACGQPIRVYENIERNTIVEKEREKMQEDNLHSAYCI